MRKRSPLARHSQIAFAQVDCVNIKSPAQAKLGRGTLVTQINLEGQRGFHLNEPR
jgi:hypothetical protein